MRRRNERKKVKSERKKNEKNLFQFSERKVFMKQSKKKGLIIIVIDVKEKR